MATKFKFEQFAGMAGCTMTADDGGSCFVFCAIPGGRPQFQFSRESRDAITIDGAPQMDSYKQFKTFVSERFADADATS